jgi:hypothetical protein
MTSTRIGPAVKYGGRFETAARSFFRPSVAACALAVCALIAGCMSPLAQHTVAFSKATDMVVDNSKDSYRAAVDLRLREQTMAAVYDYDKKPNWNPNTDFKPLLTEDQLDARIKVLDGLKEYSRSLVELTSGKSSPETQAAAAAAGASLQSLSQSVSTSLGNSASSASTTSTASSASTTSGMSTSETNAASTAVLALAKYLTARKVKGALPKVTQDMNPNIMTLCKVLNDDITILRRQADVDYTELETQQDLFIRNAGAGLNSVQHREEVGKLVLIANEKRANDALLAKLQASLVNFELTHQALAAAAQGNNPESLSQKIAELAAAGQDLGNFYKSLSATTSTTLTGPI